MIKRRSAMTAGLAMAAASSLARIAHAQSGKTMPGKPMMVFVGHEQ